MVDRHFGYFDEWGCYPGPARARRLLGQKPVRPPLTHASLEDTDPQFHIVKRGKGKCIIFHGNPGLAFYKNKNPELCRSLKSVITSTAPPAVHVDGPSRINLGMYRKTGALILHIQNSIPWSRSESFPNPVLCEPDTAKKVRISLKGIKASKISLPLAVPERKVLFTEKSGTIEFEINNLGWGEIVEIVF